MGNRLEQNAYVEDYLNAKYNAISFYLPGILSSETTDQSVNYLDRVIKIVSEIDSTIWKMIPFDMHCNMFFNGLLLLKGYSDRIDNILYEYDYEKVFSNYYQDIISKIKQGFNVEFNKEEKEFIKFLLDYDKIAIQDKICFYEFLITNVIIGENNILDYPYFKKLIIDYVKCLVSTYKVEILFDNSNSSIFDNSVFLDEDLIKKLYYEGNIEVLLNIYHQVRRIVVFNSFNEGLIEGDKETDMLKEYILANKLPDYYDNNKNVIIFNVNFRLFALNRLINFMKNNGIDVDSIKTFESQVDLLKSKGELRLRKLGDVEENFDDLFNKVIIENPNLLDKYPQLKLFYTTSFGGLVVKR